jgi:oligopeptide transport system substrate-binding protein
LARLGGLAGLWVWLAFFSGCSNNPYPAPEREVRADGTPWQVRYSALPEDPRSLDPQVLYDSVSRRILEPVQECLLEYHPLKTDPYELRPCLLESLPEKVERPGGGHTYRCRLKAGIRFHDDPCFPGGRGREVSAEDVHYAFQRIADPKVECPVFSNFQEYVVGLGAAFEEARKAGRFDYGKRLEGLQVTGQHTFELHVSRPYPQLMYWLAMHFTAPVAREAVEYYDGQRHGEKNRELFRFHPVGTGPFRIAEWKRNAFVRLVRSEGYSTTRFPEEGWETAREAALRPLAGKALPFVDEVHMTIFKETIPIFMLFRQGYLDGMGLGKDAFSSLMTPARELSAKYRERGVGLHRSTEPSTFYMSLNLEDPVLGPNRKLRQALSAAFDAQSYLDVFFNSVPLAAQQMLPPGIPGHRREFRNPYGYDLGRAKALLAEAGYPNGRDASGKILELTFDTAATSATERAMAEYEQKQFEQLGIRVRVVENTFARLMEKQDQGAFQIASGSGWMADYPDPENFLFLRYSKNVPPAGKNESRYKNAEFDALFEQMAAMENGPERERLVHRMTDLLAEDVPAILIFHRSQFGLTQPWAPQVMDNPMLEGGFKYAVLDAPLREAKRREWNAQPRWPLALLGGLGVVGAVLGVRFSRRD